MPIRVLLAFLIIFSGCLYIAYLNQESITFNYLPNASITIKPILLLFAFFVFGVVSVFVVTFMTAYRSQIGLWRISGKKRLEDKLKGMYKEGMEAEMAGNIKLAEAFYKKILKKEENNLEAMISLGELYRANGKVKEAIEIHTKAKLAHGEKVETFIALAKDYIIAESPGDALTVLQDLIKTNPTSLFALTEANKILSKQGKWKDVIENQKRIISITYDPEERKKNSKILAQYFYEYVLDLWSKDSFDELLKHIKEGISYDEEFMPLKLALGEYYVKVNKERKAIKVWWKAFVSSAQVIFLKKIEDVYRKNNNEQKIFALYYDAVSYADANPIIYLISGKIFMEMGKSELALRTIEKAKSHFSDTVAYNLALYESYRNYGKLAEAEEVSLNAVKESWNNISKYRCSKCSASYYEWQVRCDSCHSLDSLRLASSLDFSVTTDGLDRAKQAALKGEVL
ncbi:MAG: hypothetical protein HQK84_06640 [Nitrospinae bacterium]|nr:hypothetical protein [Nitrospinota bacterium]